MRDESAPPTGLARRLLLTGATAALFSGVALLSFLVLDVALPLGLLATGLLGGALVAFAVRLAPPAQRSMFRRILGAGAVAGIAATLAYDITRLGLSQLDASPYDPLEAIRGFGILFTGAETDIGFVLGVGYHALNGTMFGIAWTIALGAWALASVRRAVGSGIAWGVTLEVIMVTFYPDWLQIKAYREFLTISALSHVVYGGALGLLGRALLLRVLPAEPTADRSGVTSATIEAVRRRLTGRLDD